MTDYNDVLNARIDLMGAGEVVDAKGNLAEQISTVDGLEVVRRMCLADDMAKRYRDASMRLRVLLEKRRESLTSQDLCRSDPT